QRGIDVPDSAGPARFSWLAHDGRDPEIDVTDLQLGELLPEDEIARRSEGEDHVNLARPADLAEITRHAHHGRDAYAAADQDHALRLSSVKVKGSVRRLDLDLISELQLVMQPSRDQAMRLPLDGDLNPIAPGR